jgi:hypothetical protein
MTVEERDNPVPYEPPTLVKLGTFHELTLGCDKDFGGSDGFTFHGIPIVCTSP